MHMSQLRKVVSLGVTALVLPIPGLAQVREVVSKEVAVGRDEASLRLEFADESRLEISFEDGTVYVNGDVVGAFEPGGELESAWRELLGEAVALDDGPLGEALTDWTVPANLAGELADIAQEIDQALEEALMDGDIHLSSDDGSVSISIGDESALVRLLLGSVSRLGILEDALEGLDRDVRVHVDEDLVIPSGSVVDGTIVVIEGTIRIEGEVDGDVVVVGGAVDLRDGSRVRGEVRIADARVLRNQGTVDRGIVDIQEDERDVEAELRDQLREEIRAEVRSEVRDGARRGRGDGDSFSLVAPFRPIARAVGGVAENLFAVLVLGLVGAGVLAFAGDRLDVISETARRTPGRSAMVGFAGSFLLIPVWILGTIALAVSIIGIPVMIAWLPLFPLAACAAAVVGYLAVARNAGEWLADSEYPWTGWIRKSNSLMTMVGGLAGLMLAFITAHIVSILPFLDFFSGLLAAAGIVITVIAIQIGFGAVLLTRAGRRREYTSAFDPDVAWEAAMNVDVDDGDAASDANGVR